jgi:hypothetical protein
MYSIKTANRKINVDAHAWHRAHFSLIACLPVELEEELADFLPFPLNFTPSPVCIPLSNQLGDLHMGNIPPSPPFSQFKF